MADLSEDVIEALWAQAEPIVFITRDQFVRGLDDWDIEAIRIDGALAFVTLIQGPELHYTKIGEGPPISIKMIRGWMAPILDRYGYVTTRTPNDERRQHRLNLRIGGRITGRDEFFTHFRLDQKTCR